VRSSRVSLLLVLTLCKAAVIHFTRLTVAQNSNSINVSSEGGAARWVIARARAAGGWGLVPMNRVPSRHGGPCSSRRGVPLLSMEHGKGQGQAG